MPLHPSFGYEIVFHLVAFGVLWFWLRHRLDAPGETLTFYLAGYGVFRFVVEFVRGNEVAWAGLTRPQLFLLVRCRCCWPGSRGRPAAAPTE